MSTMTRPRPRAARGVTGIWSHTVRDKRGRLRSVSPPHANLRTDSGDDWQSQMMAGSGSVGLSGVASAVTASSLTSTGFSTTVTISGMTGGHAGQIVAAGPNASGTGSVVYAVIVSNTATVLTVDRWVDAASPFTAGTAPNATCKFQILPGQAPAWWLALSSTAITPAVTDVTLSGELTTNGFSRAAATTITHTLAAASYSLSKTFTATGTSTINAEAVFNAAGVGGLGATVGGVMAFENTEPSPPTLVSGDTIAQSISVSY